MSAPPNSKPKCATCNAEQTQSSEALKQCSGCGGVRYCSKECQKKDWKNHQAACKAANLSQNTDTNDTPRPSSTSIPTPTPAQCFVISKPFTALSNGTWLHTRPEADVYQLLSDVFRLRREDQYKYEGEVDEGSVYAGGSPASELRNYRRFITKISRLDEKRTAGKKLLPSWWDSTESVKKCVEVARTDQDAKVEYAVEKHDLQDFYKQNDMPMQLRMLGEALDGTMTCGQSGKEMLALRVAFESGNIGTGGTEGSTLMSHLSLA